jgi:hypothetical protein
MYTSKRIVVENSGIFSLGSRKIQNLSAYCWVCVKFCLNKQILVSHAIALRVCSLLKTHLCHAILMGHAHYQKAVESHHQAREADTVKTQLNCTTSAHRQKGFNCFFPHFFYMHTQLHSWSLLSVMFDDYIVIFITNHSGNLHKPIIGSPQLQYTAHAPIGHLKHSCVPIHTVNSFHNSVTQWTIMDQNNEDDAEPEPIRRREAKLVKPTLYVIIYYSRLM